MRRPFDVLQTYLEMTSPYQDAGSIEASFWFDGSHAYSSCKVYLDLATIFMPISKYITLLKYKIIGGYQFCLLIYYSYYVT